MLDKYPLCDVLLLLTRNATVLFQRFTHKKNTPRYILCGIGHSESGIRDANMAKSSTSIAYQIRPQWTHDAYFFENYCSPISTYSTLKSITHRHSLLELFSIPLLSSPKLISRPTSSASSGAFEHFEIALR